MSKKLKFGKCFACFCGYTKCKPAKGRISRKAKKEFKKFARIVLPHMQRFFGDDISSCDLSTPYKFYKKWFHFRYFIQKYKSQLSILKSAADNNGSEIYLTDDCKLGWFWEDDGDYSCSSGVMAFCYDKQSAGETWAYSELHSLWCDLYKGHQGDRFPAEITCDKQLLEFIKANPIPAKWIDDED